MQSEAQKRLFPAVSMRHLLHLTELVHMRVVVKYDLVFCQRALELLVLSQ